MTYTKTKSWGFSSGHRPVLEKREMEPSSPTNGSRYLIGSYLDPSSSWAGFEGCIAEWINGTDDDPEAPQWVFVCPEEGDAIYNISESQIVIYNGTFWAPTATTTVTEDEPDPAYYNHISGSGITGCQSASATPALVIESPPAPGEPGVPISHIINMDGCGDALGQISVDINISHTWIGDLAITLESPDGTIVTLRDSSGIAGEDIVGTYGGAIVGCEEDGYAEETITLTSYDSLSVFTGEDPSGDWILTIIDVFMGDNGVLNSWGINIACGIPVSDTFEWDVEDSPLLNFAINADLPNFTITGVSAGSTYTMMIAGDASYHIEWPSNVFWPDSSPPNRTDGMDMIKLECLDGVNLIGTVYYNFEIPIEIDSSTYSIDLVAGPLTLNEAPTPDPDPLYNRAVFANVLIDGETLIVTYQIDENNDLTVGKHLYLKTFDRQLGSASAQQKVIDVNVSFPPPPYTGPPLIDWSGGVGDGDLADHKLLLLGDHIYMVNIIKNVDQAVILKFTKTLEYVAGPVYFGYTDPSVEGHLDMGWGTDGENLYAQFYSQALGTNPLDWGAAIYKFDAETLSPAGAEIVQPDTGSFVTGTAIVGVPGGQMGMDVDRMQIFSTNRDYGAVERVGIHTFSATKELGLIEGSTVTIVDEALDTYFPVGPSWNKKHQIWVLGYTMENFETEFPDMELGPSFIKIFDAEWNELKTIQVNSGNNAFRVMTQTKGDDIYVVYDEMNVEGDVASSWARIEHYKITKTTILSSPPPPSSPPPVS